MTKRGGSGVLRIAGCVAMSIMAMASPAFAAHLIKVAEVFPGTVSSPSAQYVVLQMYAGGQDIGLASNTVHVFDSDGASLGVFTFPSNAGNGNDQAKILIATTQAITLFNITADLTMTPVIRAAGGKVCYALGGFGVLDCVAWGNYHGSATGVGTPFHPPPGAPLVGVGLEPGRALARRLDIAGAANILDGADDTNNSANDFRIATPAPRNNASQNGTIPASNCGNGVVEGLESCDGGPTCTPTCTYALGTVAVDPGGSATLTDRLLVSPNPFREEVSVLFALSRTEATDVGVFDLLGRRVRGLHQAALDAGTHRVVWDGRDDDGAPVRAGFYIMRVRSGTATMSARVLRLE